MADVMTLERLATLLDAYGAHPERWPTAERDAALALLDRSPEARRLRDQAGALDALLDRAPGATPSPDLGRRVLAGAPRPAVVRRRPARSVRAGAAVALAAAASLVVWLGTRTATTPSLDPAAVAQLGDYDVPTDGLLSALGADAETGPLLGCDDPDVGCDDADLTTSKPTATRSRRPKEMQA